MFGQKNFGPAACRRASKAVLCYRGVTRLHGMAREVRGLRGGAGDDPLAALASTITYFRMASSYLVFRTLIRQRIRGGEGVRTGRQAARREVIKIGSAWRLGLSIVSKRLTAQGMDIAAIARAKIKRRLSIYTIPRETCAST
jgi:hypothetical protein